MSNAAGSLLEPFSPAELLYLYADRFMLSFPDRASGHVSVLTSERHVDKDRLTILVGRCAVGSLLASGRVQLEPLKRSWWRGGDEVLVRVLPGAGAWPDESPETRLMAWLQRRPPAERLLGEGLADAFLRDVGRPPVPSGMSGLLAHLERTGLTRAVTERFLGMPIVRAIQVDRPRCEQLAEVDHAEVRARVAPSLAALTPTLQELVDRSIGRAIAANADNVSL